MRLNLTFKTLTSIFTKFFLYSKNPIFLYNGSLFFCILEMAKDLDVILSNLANMDKILSDLVDIYK